MAEAVAQKPKAVSTPHCDTMNPASFGVSRRGSASKGKGMAAACAVEKERERERERETATKHNVATRRPAPKRDQRKKGEI